MSSPIRPTDDAARRLARQLLDQARFASLAVLEDSRPMVTRIGLGTDASGAPLALLSDLSHHTKALRADQRASLLVGEPEEKGDPLTHPRLTLQVKARFVGHEDPDATALRDRYLEQHPKAKLYADFADFHFVRFEIERGYLNGGFGKAFVLSAEDLS